MNEQLEFKFELIEKELISVEIVEKEIFIVQLNTLDVIPRKTYIWELADVDITTFQNKQVLVYNSVTEKLENKYLSDILNFNETPINVNALPSKRFRVAKAFLTGQLQVFLNGQKVHTSEITIHSDMEFSYPIDIVANDKIEVNYLKK